MIRWLILGLLFAFETFALSTERSANEVISVEGIDEPLKTAILKGYEEAIEASTLEDDGVTSDAWGELGMLLQSHNLHEKAIFAYSRAIELAANPRWSYLRGISYQELGEVQAAVTDFKQTTAFGLEVATIWYRLANAQIDAGLLEEAKRSVSKSLELDPNAAIAMLSLAEILTIEGDLGSAKEVLERAMKLAPNAGQIPYRLAQIERQLGNTTASEKLLARVQNQHAPQIEDPMLELVASYSMNPTFFVSAARRAYERGDLETAIATYRHAVDMNPEEVENQVGFLNFLVHLEEWEELNERLGEIDSGISVHHEILLLKALALYQRERFMDALSAVQQSLDMANTARATELKVRIQQSLALKRVEDR